MKHTLCRIHEMKKMKHHIRHVSKKALTGLPLLFAIGIIALAGFIVLFSVYFLNAQNSPVTEVATQDFYDFHAHYLLMGLLRTPLGNTQEYQELNVIRSVYKDPTFVDLFANYEDIKGSWWEGDKIKFNEAISKGVRARLGNNLYFFLSVDGSTITSWPGTLVDFARFCEISGSSETIIPGRTGNHKVSLTYCEEVK